jgi:hypothetical protein
MSAAKWIGLSRLDGSLFIRLKSILLERKPAKYGKAEEYYQIPEQTCRSRVPRYFPSIRKLIARWEDPALIGVIYPLAEPNEKSSASNVDSAFIGNSVEFKRDAGQDGSAAQIGDCVVPVFYLEPGHEFIILPNAEGMQG